MAEKLGNDPGPRGHPRFKLGTGTVPVSLSMVSEAHRALFGRADAAIPYAVPRRFQTRALPPLVVSTGIAPEGDGESIATALAVNRDRGTRCW